MREYIRLTFVKPVMNKNNTKIIGYMLRDEYGNCRNFSSTEIKGILKNGAKIVGLKLGKDGRLLRNKEYKHQNKYNIQSKNLQVYYGTELSDRCKYQSGNLEERDFVPQVIKFCTDKTITNRVLILHGIRRTGKTTSIHHSILNLLGLGYNNIYLIEVTSSKTEFIELYNLLNTIAKQSKNSIVFIDEITNVIDLVDNFSRLSDQLYNLKIVVSGTDSYVFPTAYKTTLFGRTINIHTTLLGYSEYRRLTHRDLRSYISDGSLSGNEFVGNTKAVEAINSTIIGNINSTFLRNRQFFEHDKHCDYSWILNLDQRELSVIVYSILSCATEHKSNFSSTSIIKSVGKQKARFIGQATNIPEDDIPNKLSNIDAFTINNIIKALSEIDIIRQLDNLAFILCSERQLKSGYKPITEKSICVISPGLLNTILSNSNISQSQSNGIRIENIVGVSLLSSMTYKGYIIDRVGYLKYQVNKTEHEIDIVARIMDNYYNVRYALIEVKSSQKQSSEFTKHLDCGELPECLKDPDIELTKLVIYTGKTDLTSPIKWVNLEDFISNPWQYII